MGVDPLSVPFSLTHKPIEALNSACLRLAGVVVFGSWTWNDHTRVVMRRMNPTTSHGADRPFGRMGGLGDPPADFTGSYSLRQTLALPLTNSRRVYKPTTTTKIMEKSSRTFSRNGSSYNFRAAYG